MPAPTMHLLIHAEPQSILLLAWAMFLATVSKLRPRRITLEWGTT